MLLGAGKQYCETRQACTPAKITPVTPDPASNACCHMPLPSCSQHPCTANHLLPIIYCPPYCTAVHSPYFNSRAATAAAPTVLQPSSPYSNKQQQQQQHLSGPGPTGGRAAASPEPLSRGRVGYPIGFHRPSGSSSNASGSSYKVSVLLK
jgi:hypothetical protein